MGALTNIRTSDLEKEASEVLPQPVEVHVSSTAGFSSALAKGVMVTMSKNEKKSSSLTF